MSQSSVIQIEVLLYWIHWELGPVLGIEVLATKMPIAGGQALYVMFLWAQLGLLTRALLIVKGSDRSKIN